MNRYAAVLLLAAVLLGGCGDDPAQAPIVIVDAPPPDASIFDVTFLVPVRPNQGYAWEGRVDNTAYQGTEPVTIRVERSGPLCATITKLWSGASASEARVRIEAVGPEGAELGTCDSPDAREWNETVTACLPCP